MNTAPNSLSTPASTSPAAALNLADRSVYEAWRQTKLEPAATVLEPVLIKDPLCLTAAEQSLLRQGLQRDNMVWYRVTGAAPMDSSGIRRLGAQLGLHRLDANLYAQDSGVSEIRVRSGTAAGDFIPYTDRAINWHTDGYYNSAERRVRAFILHCVRPAAAGGENRLLDFDQVYIELRERHPDYLRALMDANAFAIPPLVVDGREQRGWTRGPVFTIDPSSRLPYMRYSARLRNVLWAEDAVTRAAAATLRELIDAHPRGVRLTLAAGEGLISNNVLHARSEFSDSGAGRLLLRARYYDRVGDPGGFDAVAE